MALPHVAFEPVLMSSQLNAEGRAVAATFVEFVIDASFSKADSRQLFEGGEVRGDERPAAAGANVGAAAPTQFIMQMAASHFRTTGRPTCGAYR